MIARKYTVAEIDALREVVSRKFLYGTYHFPQRTCASRVHQPGEMVQWVEEQVRTNIMAGLLAEDLLAGEGHPRAMMALNHPKDRISLPNGYWLEKINDDIWQFGGPLGGTPDCYLALHVSGNVRVGPGGSMDFSIRELAEGLSTQKIVGFIVTNARRDKFRCWETEGPAWTTEKSRALVFARRFDAESFAAEDMDAWSIVPISPAELKYAPPPPPK